MALHVELTSSDEPCLLPFFAAEPPVNRAVAEEFCEGCENPGRSSLKPFRQGRNHDGRFHSSEHDHALHNVIQPAESIFGAQTKKRLEHVIEISARRHRLYGDGLLRAFGKMLVWNAARQTHRGTGRRDI